MNYLHHHPFGTGHSISSFRQSSTTHDDNHKNTLTHFASKIDTSSHASFSFATTSPLYPSYLHPQPHSHAASPIMALSNSDNSIIHGSPQSMYATIPRSASDVQVPMSHLDIQSLPHEGVMDPSQAYTEKIDQGRSGGYDHAEEDGPKKRKRPSLTDHQHAGSIGASSGSRNSSGNVNFNNNISNTALPPRSSTVGAVPFHQPAGSEDEDNQGTKGKGRSTSQGGLPNLTSESGR